ncbi:MAG: hypothetical protein LQ338_000118 [Usnochroma carphineum]|nr:MAG: hypothetical protein LQ338_000118 [Usnochroma carphineum]
MPPKRKRRPPSQAASTPAGNTAEDVVKTDAQSKEASERMSLQDDPWTDEQETALFKGMIRWKPVGMHKHFRMIALSQYLQSSAHDAEKNKHLQIPGIWKKLGSLYNLEALDERENAFNYGHSTDGDEDGEPFCAYALPRDDFSDMMFERRLARKPSPSPSGSAPPPSASSTSVVATRRASTVDDTEGLSDINWASNATEADGFHAVDPRSSPASTRDTRAAKTSRTTRTTRRSQLNEVSSLLEQRADRKGTLEGSSVNGQNEQRVEATEEPEEEGHSALEGASKPSNAKATRRRSTRRR